MGFQIIKTNKEDIAVCGRCGLAQHMGTQGRQEALRTDSWAIVGTGGVGYIDVNTGRLKKRPLA